MIGNCYIHTDKNKKYMESLIQKMETILKISEMDPYLIDNGIDNAITFLKYGTVLTFLISAGMVLMGW